MIKYPLPALIICVFLYMVSCKKSAVNNTVQTKPVDTAKTVTVSPNAPPLANTVDKTDTLNIMAYNVLNYGDGCQGTTAVLDGYLKTIIQYAQPDLLSCEKMAAIQTSPLLPNNLADDINNNALNAAFPGKYAYAIPTDVSFADVMSVLFYNKQKLTYVKTETLVNNITDFDLYKLYYNDPNLAITKDTTFVYVVVNHTQSGSSSASRDLQVTQEMTNLRNKFSYFPNLINMGDFNVHSSYEAGYQSIISSPDTSTQMFDPPFYPDKTVAYPANWDNYPTAYKQFLTTSTRQYVNLPNSCGTSGGANSWYDHIFISNWLISGSNYMKYIPNSFRSIGNDGNRIGIDINNNSPIPNTSAPQVVLDALFQFSNKYPVFLKVQVKANRNAYSLTDPAEKM